MATTPKAEKAEEQTQQSAVPTEEQKPPEKTETQEVAEETQEPSEPSADDSEDLKLPKGASERTKGQFDKLKSQLREYRQRIFGEKKFQEMSPKPKTEEEPLFDPTTGVANVEAFTNLQRTAKEAQSRAIRAEEAVSRYIEGTQTREAVSAYPELDPKSEKFDEGLHRTTRALIMDSTVYPDSYGNKQLTYKEAADLAKEMKGEKPETSQEAAERLAPKEEASLEASGQPTQAVQKKVSSEEELERLRVGTREGDTQSMVERMRAIREAKEAEASK